jgi:hypothetical protein
LTLRQSTKLLLVNHSSKLEIKSPPLLFRAIAETFTLGFKRKSSTLLLLSAQQYRERTLNVARREVVHYMYTHGVPLQDVIAAVDHVRNMHFYHTAQYQDDISIFGAMVHYAATNNGGRAVGAVLNHNQQWVASGEKSNSGSPHIYGWSRLLSGFTSLDHHPEGRAAAGLLFFIISKYMRVVIKESEL